MKPTIWNLSDQFGNGCIGPTAVRCLILVCNCALIGCFNGGFYCFEASAVLTGLVSQAAFKFGTSICTCKSLGGVCLPTYCSYLCYILQHYYRIPELWAQSRTCASTSFPDATAMPETAERCRQAGGTRALPTRAGSGWSWHPGEWVTAHPFELFGGAVFEDLSSQGRGRAQRYFWLKLSQGPMLTRSWVGHLILNEGVIWGQGTCNGGDTWSTSGMSGDLFGELTLALQGVKGGKKEAAPPSYNPHRHTPIVLLTCRERTDGNTKVYTLDCRAFLMPAQYFNDCN